MSGHKNYNNWFMASLILFAIVVPVHFSGYFTNALYLAAWTLWMPVIALCLIGFFDYFYFAKSRSSAYAEFMTKQTLKSAWSVVLAVAAVYAIVNFVWCFLKVGDIDNIRQSEELYYVVKGGSEEAISYEEYVSYALCSFRLLSGHAALFAAIPLWYFDARKKLDIRLDKKFENKKQ